MFDLLPSPLNPQRLQRKHRKASYKHQRVMNTMDFFQTPLEMIRSFRVIKVLKPWAIKTKPITNLLKVQSEVENITWKPYQNDS